MSEPLAKERLVADWTSLVAVGIVRTSAIARSSDPALAGFFAEQTKASLGTRRRADETDRSAGRRDRQAGAAPAAEVRQPTSPRATRS